jgi:competence protein ComEC
MLFLVFKLSPFTWFVAWSLLLASFLLLRHEWSRIPDGTLRVSVYDIGQGDAALVTTPGRQRILIDGGPDLTLLERLGEELPFFDRRIDLLVLSHTDADHLRAFPEILRRYNVRGVVMTGVTRETAVYAAFLAALDEERTPVILARSDHDMDLGAGTVLDILWPEKSLFGEEVREPNDASIVAQLRSPAGSILFTGDINRNVEMELLKLGLDVESDILKVPHHGSRSSSSSHFLRAVSPTLAVVSAGRGNRYSHPHRDVLARYERLGIPVRRTDEEGNIRLNF